MNPVFVILVVLGAAALWGLLSLAFIPFEDIISWFSDDADDEIKEEKEKEEDES